MVEIEVVAEATPEAVEALTRLLPQLSTSASPLTEATATAVITFEANTVLVARVDGAIVGALTLVMFPLPSGWRAWIEDVVVDSAARGRGVGAALTREAVERAKAAGARTVDLTSRPAREAANRLYERAGFQRRDSLVYRIDLRSTRS